MTKTTNIKELIRVKVSKSRPAVCNFYFNIVVKTITIMCNSETGARREEGFGCTGHCTLSRCWVLLLSELLLMLHCPCGDEILRRAFRRLSMVCSRSGGWGRQNGRGWTEGPWTEGQGHILTLQLASHIYCSCYQASKHWTRGETFIAKLAISSSCTRILACSNPGTHWSTSPGSTAVKPGKSSH